LYFYIVSKKLIVLNDFLAHVFVFSPDSNNFIFLAYFVFVMVDVRVPSVLVLTRQMLRA